jgi:hypothetical protein
MSAIRDLAAMLSCAGYRPVAVRQGRYVHVRCRCGEISQRIGPFCRDDPPMPESGVRNILDSLRACLTCGRDE